MKIENCKLKILSFILLGLLVLYLAWLYRAELNIQSELNDNTFQFAMVRQTEEIFNQVLSGRLSFWYLFDSWNHIWGQGAPLAFYYNHLPQLLTVLSHKIIHLFAPSLSLFKYFEILKYTLLVLTPVAFYLGAWLLEFSSLARLAVALISGFIFTYGYYGIDPSSYLFAGFGLTSQLTAVFSMPLAFGMVYQSLKSPSLKNLLAATFLNFLTIQGHVGMGTILMLSEIVLIFNFSAGRLDLAEVFKRSKKLAGLFLLTLLACGYFLVPMVIHDAFRNFSLWEGLWKFNSFGWQKVVADFLNGQLFDYNRLPIITALVLVGLFYTLAGKPKFAFLGVGFALWLLAFFGRATWGPLFDFLPGLKDFYLHRFIVGIHFFGIFLAGLTLEFLTQTISKYLKKLPRLRLASLSSMVNLAVLLILFLLINPAIKNYAQNNQRLIASANADFTKDEADFEKILAILKEKNRLGRRVYAGTPGGWGRNFFVGQTPVYQRLSVLGFPVMNFYAHSWSLSSQTEPFFEESQIENCQLYNVGYFIVPEWYKPPDLAQKIAQVGKYHLYELPALPAGGPAPSASGQTGGYFSFGFSGPSFSANKNNFINLVHFWQRSELPKAKIYPLLSFAATGSQYQMVDLNHYQDLASSQIKNLFVDSPFANLLVAPPKEIPAHILQEDPNLAQQKFFAQIDNSCPDCLLILPVSFHPNWQVEVDGQPTQKLMVFPGFLAVKPPLGKHQVIFSYKPSLSKQFLLIFGWVSLAVVFFKIK